MIFFFITPMTTGAFGNYLLPLQIGARDMAFPRLNALSYWVFLALGDLHLLEPRRSGSAPNAGWFDYVPLANAQYDPGTRTRLLRPRADLQLAISSTPHRGQLHRHDPQAAGAGDVVQPDAALLLRLPRRVASVSVRAARRSRADCDLPLPRPQRRAPTSSTSRTAARRCSGSTCSGSSATPRSTSSSSRPFGIATDDHPGLHAAARWSPSRWSPSPSCSSSSSASASGPTTCSRSGCRPITRRLLRRGDRRWS